MRGKIPRLGDLFIEEGFITENQLQEALRLQKVTKERLGQVLVSMGYVKEEDFLSTLERQLNIEYIDLKINKLDSQIVQSIPRYLAERHVVLVVSRDGNRVKLAMADPLNVLAIDDVEMVMGAEVEPLLATEEDIEWAIRRYYSVADKLQGIVADMEKGQQEVNGQMETAAVAADDIEVEDAPIIRLVNSIIEQALKNRVSDIHIEPMENRVRIRYRIDGVLQEVMTPSKNIQGGLISRIKIMADLDISERRLPQDGRFTIPYEDRDIDLRVSVLPTIFGEKIVLRVLDRKNTLVHMEELGFLPDTLEIFKRMIVKPYGMVLVTGPTGCGKTTTLYSILQNLDAQEKNIVTVENPVEYRFDGINQVQVNYKTGMTFAVGLRAILRQDPNIIMVGEIRDLETAQIAIRAALTGHLVFSTLHTNDALGTITRLIDMGIDDFLVTSGIVGVVSQRLVRRICPHCKEAYIPSEEERKLMGDKGEIELLYRGKGCSLCNDTGYLGRLPVHEVLEMKQSYREMILEGQSADHIEAAVVADGMRTLWLDGLEKTIRGDTTLKELLKIAAVE